MTDDLDTLPVICPMCSHDRAYYVGREGVYRLFECAQCGAALQLQDRNDPWEQLCDALRVAAPASRIRDHGIEAWFTFRTPEREYPLGWLIDPDSGRLRRLLDYEGWIACAMTPAAILDAVELSERALSRRSWPDHPQWHVSEVVREVTP